MGMTVGGLLYKKLGEIEPFPTEDTGRFAITGSPDDKFVFKVPSLRNVAKTGPYMHDGKINTLPEMVKIMARYQLGKQVTDGQVTDIVTFLNALTGDIPTGYIARPKLPENGPDTPGSKAGKLKHIGSSVKSAKTAVLPEAKSRVFTLSADEQSYFVKSKRATFL